MIRGWNGWVADIIFVFARLGAYYYVKKGDTNILKVVFLSAHSAALRYQLLEEDKKLAQVLRFIQKIRRKHLPPSQESDEEIVLRLLKETMAKNIELLLKPENKASFSFFYEVVFMKGLNSLSAYGNYPVCYKLFSFTAEELQKAGLTKEAEEWFGKAEEMKTKAILLRIF